MASAPLCPSASWLLVQTKPKQECVAEQSLTRRGLIAYCPRVLEPHAHARAPRGPVPLFPGYVFAKGDFEGGLGGLTYASGVHHVVRFGEAFATIENADVDFLKGREDSTGYLVIPAHVLDHGDPVRIDSGAFRGFEAVVDRLLPSSQRVMVLLQVASGSWRAVLPVSDVRFTGRVRC